MHFFCEPIMTMLSKHQFERCHRLLRKMYIRIINMEKIPQIHSIHLFSQYDGFVRLLNTAQGKLTGASSPYLGLRVLAVIRE